MSGSWQNDGRKIPDEVMSYIRQMAVRAVEEKGYSPEAVINILGLIRSCIYEWLRKYRERGLRGLERAQSRFPGSRRGPIAGTWSPQWDWLPGTFLILVRIARASPDA